MKSPLKGWAYAFLLGVILWAAFSLLLVILVWAAPAKADMKLFPKWERMYCGSDRTEQFACYTFSDARNIVKIDLDLQLKLKKLKFSAMLRTLFQHMSKEMRENSDRFW